MTVGGYKDGYSVDQASNLLGRLFDSDPESGIGCEAYSELKSIYDRSQGASMIIEQMGGDHTIAVNLSDEDVAIEINGHDTREALTSELQNGRELLDRMTTVLTSAGECIQNLASDNGTLREMSRRPNLGLATNSEIWAEMEARDAMGHTTPEYRTILAQAPTPDTDIYVDDRGNRFSNDGTEDKAHRFDFGASEEVPSYDMETMKKRFQAEFGYLPGSSPVSVDQLDLSRFFKGTAGPN
jgi:hypothetical protein